MPINKDILCFNVAMYDIQIMKIKKGFSYYKQKLFCLDFS